MLIEENISNNWKLIVEIRHGENEFRPTIHLLHYNNDDGEDALAILSLSEIEKIQK